ncbi:unnamed protein product [Vitrella brassicaformis CCMP3155]|uniref:Uncharacterized protein n=2 Tax=Vitrella brassicaformis TaxID=1169539 RepID=A0A0G4FLJ3_VITBC|nr:unnamed protein product [Vitrella brassicaformis CCMP3155]|eukprot:CEM14789.1 unnamed protein product [Vitrella brassicaformis CCMP3155]
MGAFKGCKAAYWSVAVLAILKWFFLRAITLVNLSPAAADSHLDQPLLLTFLTFLPTTALSTVLVVWLLWWWWWCAPLEEGDRPRPPQGPPVASAASATMVASAAGVPPGTPEIAIVERGLLSSPMAHGARLSLAEAVCRMLWLGFMPAVLDALATVMLLYAFVRLPNGLFSLLRSSLLVFVPICCQCVLHAGVLTRMQHVGGWVVAAGLALAAYTAVFEQPATAGAGVGVVLALAAGLMQAVHVVWEAVCYEQLLDPNEAEGLRSVVFVCLEGFWSMGMVVVVMFVVPLHTRVDLWHTAVLGFHNEALLLCAGGFTLLAAMHLYTVFCCYDQAAGHRCLAELLTTLAMYGLDELLWRYYGYEGYGPIFVHSVDMAFKIVGVGLVTAGTMLYAECASIRDCCPLTLPPPRPAPLHIPDNHMFAPNAPPPCTANSSSGSGSEEALARVGQQLQRPVRNLIRFLRDGHPPESMTRATSLQEPILPRGGGEDHDHDQGREIYEALAGELRGPDGGSGNGDAVTPRTADAVLERPHGQWRPHVPVTYVANTYANTPRAGTGHHSGTQQ